MLAQRIKQAIWHSLGALLSVMSVLVVSSAPVGTTRILSLS
jgi:hypothetical protein